MEAFLTFCQEMPFVAIPVAMLLCGMGLPIPEEIVLLLAGYMSHSGGLNFGLIFGICVLSILLGDFVPFLLGKAFGPKLLRLRLVRTWMHTERLARFDAFFTKHGRLTIFVARFLPGVRAPAFFTAGSMGMSMLRFGIVDGIGAVVGSAIFVSLGKFNGEQIDQLIHWVEKTERGLFILLGLGIVAGAVYLWFRLRRRKRLLGQDVREAFVGPPSAEEISGVQKAVQPQEEPVNEPPSGASQPASPPELIAEPPASEPERQPEKKNGTRSPRGTSKLGEPPTILPMPPVRGETAKEPEDLGS